MMSGPERFTVAQANSPLLFERSADFRAATSRRARPVRACAAIFARTAEILAEAAALACETVISEKYNHRAAS